MLMEVEEQTDKRDCTVLEAPALSRVVAGTPGASSSAVAGYSGGPALKVARTDTMVALEHREEAGWSREGFRENVLNKLPDEVLEQILDYLSPGDRVNFAVVLPELSKLLPNCKTWIFSNKSKGSMSDFNHNVKLVETFVLRKGGRKIEKNSLYYLCLNHKKMLKHFAIDDLSDVSAVKHLAKECKNLRCLELSSMYQFDDSHFRLGFQKLTQVEIHFGSNKFSALDHFLQLPCLKILGIYEAELEVNSARLREMKSLAPLHTLILNHCKQLSASHQVFRYLTESLKSVEVASTDFDDDCILEMVQSAPKVIKLDLCNCYRITERGFMAISGAYDQQLMRLRLRGTEINNNSLVSLISCSPMIVSKGTLDLTDCFILSVEGFIRVLTLFGNRLKALLAFSTFIDDEVLDNLTRLCPGLVHLDVGYSQVTERGVLNVIENCKELCELKVVSKGTCMLNYNTVQRITTEFPRLDTDFNELDYFVGDNVGEDDDDDDTDIDDEDDLEVS